MGVLKVSVCNVKKTSNISITISYPENSWHEVRQVDVIFGKTIYIISNISYRQGFGERYEETKAFNILKYPDINPCVLCDDVYNRLKRVNVPFDYEWLIKIISGYNKKEDMD